MTLDVLHSGPAYASVGNTLAKLVYKGSYTGRSFLLQCTIASFCSTVHYAGGKQNGYIFVAEGHRCFPDVSAHLFHANLLLNESPRLLQMRTRRGSTRSTRNIQQILGARRIGVAAMLPDILVCFCPQKQNKMV